MLLKIFEVAIIKAQNYEIQLYWTKLLYIIICYHVHFVIILCNIINFHKIPVFMSPHYQSIILPQDWSLRRCNSQTQRKVRDKINTLACYITYLSTPIKVLWDKPLDIMKHAQLNYCVTSCYNLRQPLVISLSPPYPQKWLEYNIPYCGSA